MRFVDRAGRACRRCGPRRSCLRRWRRGRVAGFRPRRRRWRRRRARRSAGTAFTLMKPRSSSTLVPSRPIFSVLGLRPTAISSFSASMVSCLPLARVAVKRDAGASASGCSRLWRRFRRGCRVFLKTRSSSFETSSSSTGTMRGSISSTVTFVPKRLKIEANSTPTAPAPMIASVFGTAVQVEDFDVGEDASVRLQAREHARFEPVAMMMFLVSSDLVADRCDFTCRRPLRMP